MDVSEIKIDFNVNDSLAPIRAMIERLEPVLRDDNNDHRQWRLDISRSKYLGPGAATILMAVILECRRSGRHVSLILPREPAELKAFCRFSGLYQLLGEPDSPDILHPRNETVPLTPFAQARFNDPDPIIQLIHRHAMVTPEFEENLRVCVNEVIQNVQDHSASPIGGVFCARYFSQKRLVRVAIVDRGVGVRTTLLRRFPDTTNTVVALQRVVRGEYSAKSSPRNMGLGISNLCKIVRLLQGDVFLVSENASAQRLSGGNWNFQSMKVRFSGTAVFFSLPLIAQGRE